MAKKIPLTQGKFAIVDDEDYERLSVHKWHLQKCGRTYYAMRRVRVPGKKSPIAICMHREILGVLPGLFVDHIDGDGLNNQKSNLRICTHRCNTANQRKSKNKSSIFKGVTWHKATKKWASQIKKDYHLFHLGLFNNEVEAAKAYDEKAKELFGDFAKTNF